MIQIESSYHQLLLLLYFSRSPSYSGACHLYCIRAHWFIYSYMLVFERIHTHTYTSLSYFKKLAKICTHSYNHIIINIQNVASAHSLSLSNNKYNLLVHDEQQQKLKGERSEKKKRFNI